ncbi:MAG: PAS domain S-box protein [Methylobacter sp.]
MKLGLKRKIVLVFVGVLVAVTALDALLASYFTKRQNQDAAFATLKRDLLTWQDELQELTLHMRAVALSAIGETVALNQLSELKALDYKLADALTKNKEVKEAARTLAFSKSVSLNRLHLVLRSGGFSAIAVYIDGKLSHRVAVSEVGMFVQKANGAQTWVKAAADGNGNLPIRSWPAWQEGAAPVAASLAPLDKTQVAFTYPSADSMLIEVAVPVEGVIDYSLPQGELDPSELSVIDPRIAGSASDSSIFSENRPLKPFAMVVFQKRIDRSFLQTVEQKTGMWPLLFSPDGQHRQQTGPLNLSLQELLPDFTKASAGIRAQTVSTGQDSFYAAALPWQFEQQPGFVLALVASQDSTLQNIRQTVLAILAVTGLILAFSIGVGIFWLGRFIDPIIALTHAVKAIGLVSRLERDRQSDYRLTAENLRPLAISAPGEIGDLAWAFDVMIGELHYSFDSLEQRVQERTIELLALHQVLEKQNRQLEEQSTELSASNSTLQEEIGERQLIEDLLRLREQEFRSLAENSPDNIARYDREGRVKYLNTNLCTLLGITYDFSGTERFGMTIRELYPDGSFDAYAKIVETVIETGLGNKIEVEIPNTGEGGARYHQVQMVAERDQYGEVIGVLALGRDITERRQMEAALLRNQRVLTEAQRIAHIGSWELDLADNVLEWSDEIFRIFEIDQEQFGASYAAFLDAVHPDDRETVNRAYTESLKTREPYEIEHRLLMADGRIKHVLERCETRYADDGAPLYSMGTVQDITERKRMEAELISQADFQQTILNAICDVGMQVMMIENGLIIHIGNRKLATEFGFAGDEVDAYPPLIDIIHPDDRARVMDYHTRRMAGESVPNSYELGLVTRCGERREYETSVAIVPGSNPIRMITVGKDITERKQTEAENRRLINILELSADFIGSADMQGNLLYHNRAARRMTGLPEDADLSGMHLADMHPEWATKIVEEQAIPALLKDGVWRGETALLHRDGREIPVSQLLMLHRDADGKPLFHSTIMQDITERKQAENEIRALNADLELRVSERTEELRRQTSYLRTMIDTLPMMAWFKDTDSRFLVVNQALATASSHSEDDLVGKSDLDIWPREHAEAYRADDAEVMATRQRKAVEEPFVDAQDGAIWIETFKAPVMDEDGRVLGTVGVARDISERKAVEVAREAALAEAERLARLRSEFMARMSHELRTPLNGILGYSQIMLGENQLNERYSVMLDVIQQSGEYLLCLINDILDFAKIEAGKQELSLGDISLAGFLNNLTSIINVKAEQKHLAFVCDIAADVPRGIRVDETRLRQVLLNLLSNAVKYSEQGQISLRVTVLKSKAVDLSNTKPSPEGEGAKDPAATILEPVRLRFEIQDTGIGIDAGQLETIFQPFEQAGDSRHHNGGSGLGLVISRELVRLMGSDIHVSSRVGEGSTFWFDLDVPVVAVYGNIMPAEQRVSGYQGARRRVLVVDDVYENRALLVDILSRLGFETAEAANGRACLDSVAALRPDLILLDMVMPEMDGMETAQRLRQLPGSEQTPIIAISASASGSDIGEVMKSGVSLFLSKPVDIKQLMVHIAGLLKLDWIYALPEAESLPQQKLNEWLEVPPLEEMKILHRLAQEGSMRDIIGQAAYLGDLDERYRPFAEQLRMLARGYQSKAILNLVNRYINRYIKEQKHHE